MLSNSSLPILVVTHFSDPPLKRIFWASEEKGINYVKELAELLPSKGYLIANFDDETSRELGTMTKAHCLTIGFGERADFQADEIHFDLTGTNLKVSYQGNIIPLWLDKLFGKENIYAALAGIACGSVLGINLVDVTQIIGKFQSDLGKMRLIKGVKNSWILDDSQIATPLSMMEAIEIFGKFSEVEEKIAVLGDVLGIGKYTLEVHEEIGKKVAENADILFTFGPRAKFIAKGAFEAGMGENKIFKFDTIDEGRLKLQDKIKKGDLILVDGSKEMKMERIIKEIRADY